MPISPTGFRMWVSSSDSLALSDALSASPGSCALLFFISFLSETSQPAKTPQVFISPAAPPSPQLEPPNHRFPANLPCLPFHALLLASLQQIFCRALLLYFIENAQIDINHLLAKLNDLSSPDTVISPPV